MSLPGDLITPKAAARLLKVHVSSVYRWILAGKVRAFRRAGARYWISEAEVRAAWAEVEPTQPTVIRTPAQDAAAARQAIAQMRADGHRV